MSKDHSNKPKSNLRLLAGIDEKDPQPCGSLVSNRLRR